MQSLGMLLMRGSNPPVLKIGQSGFTTLVIIVAVVAVSGLMLLASYEQSLAALQRYLLS